MYEELVERLRERATWINFPHHGEEYPTEDAKLMMDAADAIEELSREVDIDNAAMTAMDAAMPRWIPVTERLPEKPEGYPKCEIRRTYYLVALKSGCVKTLGYEFDRDEWQITGSPVVAWMTLPEPPKEET